MKIISNIENFSLLINQYIPKQNIQSIIKLFKILIYHLDLLNRIYLIQVFIR